MFLASVLRELLGVASRYSLLLFVVHRVLVVLEVTLRPSLARVSFPLLFAPVGLPRNYAVAQLA